MTIGAISLSKHTCVMLGAVRGITELQDSLESEKQMSIAWLVCSTYQVKATELLSLTDILVFHAFFLQIAV